MNEEMIKTLEKAKEDITNIELKIGKNQGGIASM